MAGWVIFRADTLPHATAFWRVLLGLNSTPDTSGTFYTLLTNQVALGVYVGVLCSTPLPFVLAEELRRFLPDRLAPVACWGRRLVEPVLLIALLIVCAAWLADGTYNPFIYYRF